MAHARGPAVQGCFNDRLARGLILQWLSTPSGGDLPNRPDVLFEHPLAPQLHRGPAHLQLPSDRRIILPRKGGQNNPAAQRHLLRRSV